MEMAVVMVILAMLIGGLVVPLTAQIDQRDMNETRKSLSEIKEALMGFAITSGRLPCPAISSTNGDEKLTCVVLADRHGYIPWAKLGVPKLDAWGHMFRYSVTPAYAGPSGTLVLSPPTIRDITIQTRDVAGTLVNLSTPSNIPAVVLSHGKNGYGSTDDQGVVAAVPIPNIDDPKHPCLAESDSKTSAVWIQLDRDGCSNGYTCNVNRRFSCAIDCTDRPAKHERDTEISF